MTVVSNTSVEPTTTPSRAIASNWVAVLPGVHEYEPGHLLDAVLDPANVFVFDAADRLVAAPDAALSGEVRSGSREENLSTSKSN